MSAAMFEPRLPTDAKKIRRLIGEKKWYENMYVARTKRMAAIERDELIRSVMTRALVCAAVRPATLDTILAGRGKSQHHRGVVCFYGDGSDCWVDRKT